MAPTIPIDYTGQRESKKCSKTGSGNMKGKTRKITKVYSSRLVPDFRHAVETMAESAGFGSSGRVPVEFIPSEDSSARNRKCISLNVDGYDKFGGQILVLSLSKMSNLERRDLEVRLKKELEQVRMLQRNIASYSSGDTECQPNSDIHTYEQGLVRSAVAESIPTSMNEVIMPPGKKKATTAKNGPCTEGGVVAGRKTARKKESLKPGVKQNAEYIMLMRQCGTLLNQMMSQKSARVFNDPVDAVKLNIPDYFDVIKHPMDFGTIKRKLRTNQYSSPKGFAADVRLTFKNALTYNPSGTEVHHMAERVSKFFEIRWKAIEKKIPAAIDESGASKSSVIREPREHPAKKQKTMSQENKVNQETDKRIMTKFEKQKLGAELEALLAEQPENIIEFLKGCNLNGSQVSEDEIEIDIDTLCDDTLFMLRKLLDDYLLEKQKNQTKIEPCEIEICNNWGFSNLSVQPSKDNGLPISSSHPMGMDKDADQRDSKNSTSRSSSSELSSSPSDTESGSSADGELDVIRDSVPASTANETIEPIVDKKESDLGDPNSGDLLDGHAEQNLPSKSSSVDLNCRQEGESAPSERQVSPHKLHRAALLRSRFADIIIKAQENPIEKGERPDPEKIKLDREGIERRRREEKARLQAEAKAAEEARKIAEVEAAAEAKRKIERKREAARQALQKMEKTVEINENSQFMEDLEMFRAARDDHLQIFSKEESPESSENGFGSFKFQANSNPLEQLGLYMKNDEEDEEVEPQSNQDTSNDPEEGEND